MISYVLNDGVDANDDVHEGDDVNDFDQKEVVKLSFNVLIFKINYHVNVKQNMKLIYVDFNVHYLHDKYNHNYILYKQQVELHIF